MEAFKGRETDILVATTVIEVGIDIPNATIIVVEHAERFGLAQLHQLRGRVGRGTAQSYCILMAPDWMKQRSKAASTLSLTGQEDQEELKAIRRLKMMEKSTNGFKIAEIDLELRGPGDFFGTRQSGLPELQIANLVTDGELLNLARTEAFNVIEGDPHLRLAVNRSLREYVDEWLKDSLALLEVG
jgi:ATP-dependent DNA helicase RecG